MIVVCNGGNRTGSTLAFNVALKVAERTGCAGPAVRSVGASHAQTTGLCALDPAFLTGWWFVKSHDFVPGPVYPHAVVLHTHRAPLAVAASWCRVTGEGNPAAVVDLLRRQAEMLDRHRDRPDTLVVPYPDLRDDLPGVVRAVAGMLGLVAVADAVVDGVCADLSVDAVREYCRDRIAGPACPYTQLRPNHVSPAGGDDAAWAEYLPPGVEAAVRRAFGVAAGVP